MVPSADLAASIARLGIVVCAAPVAAVARVGIQVERAVLHWQNDLQRPPLAAS